MIATFKSFFKRFFVKSKPGNDGVKPELLIFGLGNPGPDYAETRHNIGFGVIDELCAAPGVYEVSAPKEYCQAICRTAVCGENRKPVLFVKPLTYMNRSGEAVWALAKRYGLTLAECLVIVDDFNIPLGKVRFRKDGTHGGHNGLKSISTAVGSECYPRLRMGVGPLPAGFGIVNFVLGRFEEWERDDVEKVTRIAAEAVVFMIDNGIDTAMNRYN